MMKYLNQVDLEKRYREVKKNDDDNLKNYEDKKC